MKILALECSTSSAKAMVFDTVKGVRNVFSKAFDSGTADLCTQDPKKSYRLLMECGKNALNGENVCDAVVLISTWHSLLLCESNLRPSGRIRLWSDLEAGKLTKSLSADEKTADRFYRKTGCILHATYPIWKYKYLLETGKIEPGLSIYSHGEYLLEKMTGVRAVPGCIASGSGLMSLESREWDEQLLKTAGIHRNQLGPICEDDFSAPLSGEAAGFLNLKPGTPVYAGLSDGCATQLGCEATKRGEMTVSVGTSGALRMTFERPVLSDRRATWCYYLSSGKYLAGAATNGACNCVNAFARESGKSLKTLDGMLSEADPLKAPVYLPFVYGERSPGWSDQAYGGFDRAPETTADGYYAVLEGVLFNLFQCFEELRASGADPGRIRVTGGISNSDAWLKMFSDIFGREIEVSATQHASLLGGAALAAAACGEYRPGLFWKTDKVIKPDRSKSDLYSNRYSKYKKLYLQRKRTL